LNPVTPLSSPLKSPFLNAYKRFVFFMFFSKLVNFLLKKMAWILLKIKEIPLPFTNILKTKTLCMHVCVGGGGMAEVAVSCRVVRVIVSPVCSHRPVMLPVLVLSHVILRVLVLCQQTHLNKHISAHCISWTSHLICDRELL
jgi:hypothetical protein